VRNLALGDSEDDRGKELEKGRKTAHDTGSKAAEDREAADGNGRRGEGEGGGEARSQRKQGAGDGGHGAWIVFKEQRLHLRSRHSMSRRRSRLDFSGGTYLTPSLNNIHLPLTSHLARKQLLSPAHLEDMLRQLDSILD
jgi:hypothetical protein